MGDHRRTRAWRLAREHTKTIYETAACFPRWEEYGLKAQITRASNGVKANIAEGLGRGYPREIERFCRYAIGSVQEVDSHLSTALDAGFISQAAHDQLITDGEVIRIAVRALIRKCAT